MPIRSVSKELQAKAIAELNEEVARIPDDIQHIKNWLKQTKYINGRTDDQWILAFLRGCKYSLERTKEKFETYYTMKTLLPEIFNKRDPMSPEIQEILSMGIFLPLPNAQSPSSPRIILLRGGCFDASKIDMLSIMKVNLMIQDILLMEDDQLLIAGGIMVQDMKGVTMAHMGTPALMKKGTAIFQEAYPARPKGIHFLNIPSFFETIYSIIKPFLNEKMKSRMVVHKSSNLDELYKTVPQSLLPKEYGGDAPPIAEIAAEWKKKVESYKGWFKDEEKFGTDEKKRPGKPKTADELFGIEGSFRKLNVD